MELLVAEAQAVLLHLELAVEVLPVGDLEGEAHRRPAQPSSQQGLADLADELEGLFGLDDRVDPVDAPLLLEHLAQQLGTAGGLQGGHLGRGGRARTDTDA